MRSLHMGMRCWHMRDCKVMMDFGERSVICSTCNLLMRRSASFARYGCAIATLLKATLRSQLKVVSCRAKLKV
jgi:hexokinase